MGFYEKFIEISDMEAAKCWRESIRVLKELNKQELPPPNAEDLVEKSFNTVTGSKSEECQDQDCDICDSSEAV